MRRAETASSRWSHALYATSANWSSKTPGRYRRSSCRRFRRTWAPNSNSLEIAKLSELQAWAAQRGVPSAQEQRLPANQNEINQLVQMNGDATTQYPEFPGTPSFVLNGKMLKETATWEKLEPQIRDALGS